MNAFDVNLRYLGNDCGNNILLNGKALAYFSAANADVVEVKYVNCASPGTRTIVMNGCP
jgi:hypothetical protein